MWYSLIDSATLSTIAITQFTPDVSEGQTLLTWPEGVDPVNSFYEPVKDTETGVISLVENTQKKTQSQWTSVRAQQRQKLYESDWTCSVTDYEVPNKSEWVQYRAALRDVTKQADPFAIVWPVAPV
jgi:hypothetical protein